MALAISRRAAPKMSVLQMCELAGSRGLDGVELVESDLAGHGLAGAASGRAVGIHVESSEKVGSPEVLRRAKELGAPVVASLSVVQGKLPELARLYREAGAKLLVSHRTSLEDVAAVVEAVGEVDSPAIGVAWEVHTKADDLSLASSILLATTGVLSYIRMYGGGPELPDDESVGTGALVTAIALSGYKGVIVQGPTSATRTDDWEKWLMGNTKHGCGTAHEKKAAARRTSLDIRPVEPKDRMATILGAYHALTPGKTLRVTFDHDPSCMYYTLQATEPEGSFRFERGEEGPAVWSADVTRVS